MGQLAHPDPDGGGGGGGGGRRITADPGRIFFFFLLTWCGGLAAGTVFPEAIVLPQTSSCSFLAAAHLASSMTSFHFHRRRFIMFVSTSTSCCSGFSFTS